MACLVHALFNRCRYTILGYRVKWTRFNPSKESVVVVVYSLHDNVNLGARAGVFSVDQRERLHRYMSVSGGTALAA